ncbi:hypothetical protein Q7C36_010379 [Tachysurus vachellii]|uniref:Uncharacterized protein n=1 Tax=Tachysurus vachellii TaxID=175792 RepID=A0AA88SWN0_TACVA|nr:hypothetical protein Q7C36_010379 [Tachysurus vachellii]
MTPILLEVLMTMSQTSEQVAMKPLTQPLRKLRLGHSRCLMAEIINKADESLGGWWWLLPGQTAFFSVSQHDFMLVSAVSGGGLAELIQWSM